MAAGAEPATTSCHTVGMAKVRRRSTADHGPACNYASIGATASSDLLTYPPRGFRAAEYRVKLGSGRERFERSLARLMRFGVQRGAGLQVRDVRQPESNHLPGMPGSYGHLLSVDDELVVRPGTTANMATRVGPLTFSSPVRVLGVTFEERACGYTYGTLPGGPEAGEQLFLVSWDDDNTVWLTIREFVRPGNWWIRLVWWYANAHRKRVLRRYLAALHPATPQPHEESDVSATRDSESRSVE